MGPWRYWGSVPHENFGLGERGDTASAKRRDITGERLQSLESLHQNYEQHIEELRKRSEVTIEVLTKAL